MRVVLSLFLTVLLGACARPGGEASPFSAPPATPRPNPTPTPNPAPEPTPTPKTPEEFYRQFLFQSVGACGTRSHYYRFADSQPFVIAVNKFGQDVMVELSLLMYPDHTYRAFYEEIDVISYSADGYYWKDSRFKYMAGQWRIRKGQLELSGLGVAVPAKGFVQPTMLFSANQDLITEGLKNFALVMRIVAADYVPVREVDPCRKPKAKSTVAEMGVHDGQP